MVVTVAENCEAMVQLGRRNSRMKDFHDIWALSSGFAFEGPTLREAVVACFERRRTAWTREAPDLLGSAFYGNADLQARWGSYIRAGACRTPPPAGFESIGERVRGFLGPIRDSVVAGVRFEMRWGAGGPWH
jgi:hypothetical protein